ncbi:MAG: acetyltransferase [Ignavibacteriaceae bacterium]|nr:acetyltransferase [Ignavibacteriaceae bacterium]
MKTVIFGNGAMAKVLYSYSKHKKDVCGFTVDDSVMKNETESFCGLPLVPFSKADKVFKPSECNMIISIGFIDMNELREKKHFEAIDKGYKLDSYIHPSVMIHDDLIIESDCIILDHVSIHPGTIVKQGTFISSNVNIGHDCTIEAFNYITSGVSIAGGSKIGEKCFLGINSSVGHGIRLGKRNFIAANTLINKNTLDDEVYLSESGQRFRLKSKSFLKFVNVLD